MTDAEFFKTLKTLSDHATARRQESLAAADVEAFKEWDYMVMNLESPLSHRKLDRLMKSMEKLQRGDKAKGGDESAG